MICTWWHNKPYLLVKNEGSCESCAFLGKNHCKRVRVPARCRFNDKLKWVHQLILDAPAGFRPLQANELTKLGDISVHPDGHAYQITPGRRRHYFTGPVQVVRPIA